MSMIEKYKTREEWLIAALVHFKDWFKAHGGHALPNMRVTCGWPSSKALSEKSRCLGEAWKPIAAEDGIGQVFISPFLAETAGPGGVLAVLVHEVVHQICYANGHLDCGHKNPFKSIAKAAGLEGKMTHTIAGEVLCEAIKGWAEDLGIYPHSRLDKSKSPKKKQTTRMIKAECEECGFTCRLTQKWIDSVGAPHCPKHGEMKLAAPPVENPEDAGGDE